MTGSPKKHCKEEEEGGGEGRRGEGILGKVSNTQGGEMSMGEKLGKTYVYCYLDIISIVLWIP